MVATELEPKQADRHKPGSFMIRLPGAYAGPLDDLVGDQPGSDRTEFVRRAVLEFLQRAGKWPTEPNQ